MWMMHGCRDVGCHRFHLASLRSLRVRVSPLFFLILMFPWTNSKIAAPSPSHQHQNIMCQPVIVRTQFVHDVVGLCNTGISI